MENTVSTPILVTGATGYVASHCIKLLLERGYKVRGTVRSLANNEKYQFLYDLVPESRENLTLVEANLSDAQSWPAVVEGCEYILHIASPIPPYIPKDENEIIKPAVDGTLNVLNSALEKKAKKVVITSSCLAVWIGNGLKVVDENDWAVLEYCHHYPKSKVLAEKAAWEFYENNKDKIAVTVVNPSLVFGPTFTKHGNSSETLMAEIFKGSFPGIPDPEITWAIVDVRDAAEGHLKALFKKEADGRRYILSGWNLNVTETIDILKGEFEKFGYILPSKKITAEEIKASGNPIALRSASMMGQKINFTNERSIKELGLEYRNKETTIIDMGYSLIKNGVVEDKRK